jgi:hypothetical protein
LYVWRISAGRSAEHGFSPAEPGRAGFGDSMVVLWIRAGRVAVTARGNGGPVRGQLPLVSLVLVASVIGACGYPGPTRLGKL